MRDLGRDYQRVHERWSERAAQKLPDLVAACEQRLDALADLLDRSDRIERRQLRRLARPIRQRRRIEREDLEAGCGLLALVETLTGLVADPAAFDQLADKRRQCELTAAVFRGQTLGQVSCDMSEHVDTDDVHRAERRTLWTAEHRACQRVDLFNGVLAGFERTKHPDHTV